jgi:hypothetical protein
MTGNEVNLVEREKKKVHGGTGSGQSRALLYSIVLVPTRAWSAKIRALRHLCRLRVLGHQYVRNSLRISISCDTPVPFPALRCPCRAEVSEGRLLTVNGIY